MGFEGYSAIGKEETKEYDSGKLRFVTYILHRLSISPGHPGFYYLRDAILIADRMQRPVPSIGALIWEIVAQQYGVDRRKMDRAIHRVMEQLARNMTRAEALRIITGIEVHCINKPFKNIEFISYMVEALRLRFLEE